MKKLLLSVFSLVTLTTFATPISIEKADLNWTIGNQWYMVNTSGQNISGFTSTGTSAVWNLTSFESGSGVDTVKAAAATGGAGAVVNINSNGIPATNYTETGTDYQVKTVQYNAANYPTDGSLTIGLPHSYGATWSEATTILGAIAASVSGEVIAAGQVITSWGTFDAVLVQEDYNIGGSLATYYYWETKEYGRIGYLINGTFSLMVGNNFGEPTSANEVVASDLNLYPNPASDQFTVSGTGIETVKVYDAIGNLVVSEIMTGTQLIVNTSAFNNGLYLVQVSNGTSIETKTILVK